MTTHTIVRAGAIGAALSLGGGLGAAPVGGAAPASFTFELPPQARLLRGGAPAEFELSLPIAGALRTLVLSPVSLRTSDFRLLVSDAQGELVEIQPPAPRTLRGGVDGLPEARAAGSLLADGLHLLIRGVDVDLDGEAGEVLLVEPTGNGTEHRLVQAIAELPDGFCGVIDLPELDPPAAEGGVAGTQCARLVQIAFDADFEFDQSNGSSVPSTVADIENVFAGVEDIYATELDVPFLVGTIIVRSTSNDPYTTNVAGDLLGELANEWAGNQASVPRDVVHLFTGKNIAGSTIGIAFNPGACVGAGYSLSQSKWSLQFNNRVTVCAHELGHNFGADHCNGEGDCGIMCAAVGACPGGILSFGAFETDQLLGYIDQAECLGPIQPTGLFASAGTVCDQIQVSWVAAPEAVSHTVWRAPLGAGQEAATAIATGAVSPYFDAGVPAGQTFQYWISAIFADGCESNLTGPVLGFIPTPIGAPATVIAADDNSCTTVGLIWSSVTGANGYQIWRGIGDDPAAASYLADDSSSPYFDNSAVPGVVYRYWVRTKNNCGQPGPFGTSDLGSRKAAPAAGTPSAGDGVSCADITVSWPAVAGATSYTLWRGGGADPGQASVLAAAVSSPYIDATVTPGQTYWYFVQSTNNCGSGQLGAGDPGSAGTFGDLTGDCVVDGADLGALLSQWGSDGAGDLNDDGIVDGADLGLLTAAWTA